MLAYLSSSLALMSDLLEKWQLWRTQPPTAEGHLHIARLFISARVFFCAGITESVIFCVIQLFDVVNVLFFYAIKH